MNKITEELAQRILDYLIKQPYIEVYEMINGIQNMEKIDPKDLKKAKK